VSEPAAPVGITGATGRLGSRVAQRLAMTGVRQRLLVRDLTRAPRLPGADAVRASFAEPDAVREGLRGIPAVLMVSASGSQTRVAAIANGELSAVTDDVRRLTGHPATTLAELLRSGRSAY
jgi:uncharacterized protein YbjT (DUF2867 family)